MDDPYKTLGVSREASQDDIRRAYLKLAKQHHPDLNPGNATAEARFKSVSAANDMLSDAEQRSRFDRGEIDAAGQEQAAQPSYRDYADTAPGRRYGRPGSSAGGWNAADLGDIFGGAFSGAHADIPIGGQDEHYTLTTSFIDSVLGATPRLTLPDGRTLDVKIPPGTSDGQILRLRNQGGAGWNGGPNGDALIEIRVTPHPYFKRDGQDIRVDLPVSLSEAVLGGPVEVVTPGGPVRMRIPPHSDTGTELRLRGRGVPAFGGRQAGDLYATLRVVLGTPDAALEGFLREWQPEHPTNPRRGMGEAP